MVTIVFDGYVNGGRAKKFSIVCKSVKMRKIVMCVRARWVRRDVTRGEVNFA